MRKIPILLYHDLESPDCPNEKTDPATKDTVVHADNFEAQIRYLSQNGYKTVSLREYFEFQANEQLIPPKSIIITFDDGHYSNYCLALPILKRHGFKATFFVVADRVDRKYHLARDHMKEMIAAEMEIGSHGLTHTYLPLMDSREVEHELQESKNILECITEMPIDYFAFPGGHYNRGIMKLLLVYGYKGACSCIHGLNDLQENPYLLRRIEIRKRLSPGEFEHVFSPGHIIFFQFIDVWKSLVRRTIGLKAYGQMRSRLFRFYIFKR